MAGPQGRNGSSKASWQVLSNGSRCPACSANFLRVQALNGGRSLDAWVTSLTVTSAVQSSQAALGKLRYTYLTSVKISSTLVNQLPFLATRYVPLVPKQERVEIEHNVMIQAIYKVADSQKS